MNDFDINGARFNMVEQQIRPWNVFDEQVLDLMKAAPRHEYVPVAYKNLAFADMHIPLGGGREMMPPKVEARALQAIEIQPDDHILEIGTGCGYLTSLLAKLGKEVISTDSDGALSQRAGEVLSRHGIDNVRLEVGDALDGWDAHAPYDVIVINGSLPSLPEGIRHNLAIGGRLFAVIGEAPVMEARLIQRASDAIFNEAALFETDLAPLPGAKHPQHFEF